MFPDSQNNNSSPKTFLGSLRDNLALIIFVISAIFGYANLQGRVSTSEKNISQLQAEAIEDRKTINSFSNDITYIKTTLDYIKLEITSNKN